MLNKLFSFLPKHSALSTMKDIFEGLETLLEYFEYNYQRDENVREAAIDAFIELLNSLKTNPQKPVEVDQKPAPVEQTPDTK